MRSLYDWFHHVSQHHGAVTALEVGELTLTYAQLEETVTRLAAEVERTAGRRPERVGLLMSRSVAAYAGYLAVLRLGATVVPMNPRTPASRNVSITVDAGLDATIVDDTSGYWCAEYVQKAGVPIVDLTGDRWRALVDSPGDGAPISPPHDDIAYIVFTSGSTGKPKGVPVTHGNISAFLEEIIPRFGFGPGSRVSQTFELSFDAALMELFGAWGSGGTLCVPRHRDIFNPVPHINEQRLTHWLTIPSMIAFAMGEGTLAPGSMPHLKCTVLGGEPLSSGQVSAWTAAAPNAVLHNCYGPTELTLVCTDYPIPSDPGEWPRTSNDTMPIGAVYPSLEYLLLDQALLPADEGELCVRGAQRFPGYLDPAHNTGRFVSFDGKQGRVYEGDEPLTAEHWYRTGDLVRREGAHLVHRGRIDAQIKIHGFRIELGEIEAVVRRHPAVIETVVIATVAEDGETDLHAVYTGEEVEHAELAELATELPLYMRPRVYHHRDSIPLTSNGKVDRNRLLARLHL